MPIYAYKCESCGHRQDVLQKISDPLLTQCPSCSAATFVKQVTAAGFQLKGSGWYVTDFRDGGGKKSAAEAEAAKPGEADKTATVEASGKDASADKSSPEASESKASSGAEKSGSGGAAPTAGSSAPSAAPAASSAASSAPSP